MREDFYYRVHAIPIQLPPPGPKGGHAPPDGACPEGLRQETAPRGRPAVMDSLLEYDWSGNVRELQNVLYRFVTLKRIDFHGRNAAVKTTGKPMLEVDPGLVAFIQTS